MLHRSTIQEHSSLYVTIRLELFKCGREAIQCQVLQAIIFAFSLIPKCGNVI